MSKRKRMDRSWESNQRVVPVVAQDRSRNVTVTGVSTGDRAGSVKTYQSTKIHKNDNKFPFIQVDGNRYYADRFYLLAPTGDETSASASATPPSCTCGAQQAPPTLDRARLIQSLDLKAAILGTYTVSPSHVIRLFEDIPTLVLHGHKGLESRLETVSNHNSAASSTLQRSDVTRKPASGSVLSSSAIVKQEEDPPEEAWFADQQSLVQEQMAGCTLPPTLYMTRILTTWLPPRVSASLLQKQGHGNRRTVHDAKARTTCAPNTHHDDEVIVVDGSDDEMEQTRQDNPQALPFKGVDHAVAARRLSKRGVHHPKFMLLFEKCGSLVVLVSTSNLTSQESLDGVWVQRFMPTNRYIEPNENTSPQPTLPRNKIKERRHDGSDFGHVLADFIQKQSDAAQVGSMLPVEFIRHYLSIDNLDAFRDAFSFQDAQVHLIATIPGDHHGKLGVTHLGRKDGMPTFLYGAQRVADIMERLSNPKDPNVSKPWFPSSELLSDEDRLILQPTSLGGYWTASNMANLARTYMGRDTRDSEILDNMDIMWPANDFIQTCVRKKRPLVAGTKLESLVTTESEREESNGTSGFIFLASHIFNTIDVNVISRMVQYTHSNPNQISSLRAPHFKSYARLFEGNEYALRSKHGVGKAAEIFSWFLLSSACLSRGAQGIPTEDRSAGTDQISYSNFELGVLFCSRLQGTAGTDRVYCWKPNQCTCGTNKNQKLIHLPIPYAVRAQPFQSDPDEAHMCKTPYFHEITPESASVGLMALTPYGKMRVAKEVFRTVELNVSPQPS